MPPWLNAADDEVGAVAEDPRAEDVEDDADDRTRTTISLSLKRSGRQQPPQAADGPRRSPWSAPSAPRPR